MFDDRDDGNDINATNNANGTTAQTKALVFRRPNTFGSMGVGGDGNNYMPNVKERASAISHWKLNKRDRDGMARAAEWASSGRTGTKTGVCIANGEGQDVIAVLQGEGSRHNGGNNGGSDSGNDGGNGGFGTFSRKKAGGDGTLSRPSLLAHFEPPGLPEKEPSPEEVVKDAALPKGERARVETAAMEGEETLDPAGTDGVISTRAAPPSTQGSGPDDVPRKAITAVAPSSREKSKTKKDVASRAAIRRPAFLYQFNGDADCTYRDAESRRNDGPALYVAPGTDPLPALVNGSHPSNTTAAPSSGKNNGAIARSSIPSPFNNSVAPNKDDENRRTRLLSPRRRHLAPSPVSPSSRLALSPRSHTGVRAKAVTSGERKPGFPVHWADRHRRPQTPRKIKKQATDKKRKMRQRHVSRMPATQGAGAKKRVRPAATATAMATAVCHIPCSWSRPGASPQCCRGTLRSRPCGIITLLPGASAPPRPRRHLRGRRRRRGAHCCHSYLRRTRRLQ